MRAPVGLCVNSHYAELLPHAIRSGSQAPWVISRIALEHAAVTRS